ncbi:protein SIEVE ELEMENT OCCLUSION B-like [Eucalyptus grandis]|uniref:protein SIEVE ELEMENT OCCLUSION B-like n=1 Tax=Eucalyptus grandis TaxID=71139 RepID=UPI00192E8EAC|nr:protein SIEVE ELEMENT OCCLUSION B-like [Eucalyptus grandis]
MAKNNGNVTAVAGNNGSITMTVPTVLDLLEDANFKEKVTSKPRLDPKEVDVKSLNLSLSLVEKILNQALDSADDVANTTWAKDNQGQSDGLAADLTSTIGKLYDKFEAPQINNEKQTIQLLVDELSSFSWDAKAVLTLLAFTAYCTESFFYTQFGAKAKLLRLTASVRGKPPPAMTKAFVDLSNLIRKTLEFTKCIVEYGSYCKNFEKKPGMSKCILDNSYYIIVFVLRCSDLFSRKISRGNELEEPDLSNFLRQVMTKYQYFKEKGEELLYQNIEEISSGCTDIVDHMTALFSSTVYQCSKKTTVKVEELKNKSVILLILDLKLSDDDRTTLTSIYNVSTFKSDNYEIMWVPIVKGHDEEMKQFLDMRSGMPWYTCTSMVSKPAVKFIEEKWQFRQQTMVVVLNKEGKVVNKDAMTMIRVWGWKACPFTELKYKDLWSTREMNWLELMVNETIASYIDQSFERKELLLLYDSVEDSKTVREIEEYLEKIKGYSVSFRDIRIGMKRDKFLTRLENCIFSKMHVNQDINNALTQELLKLYTSYKKQGGFAIVARGSRVVVNARLTDFATVLSQHQTWIKRVTQTQDFEAVFQEHYDQVIVKPRCHHFYIPNMVDHVPKRIECPACSREMKTAITYECCHGAH